MTFLADDARFFPPEAFTPVGRWKPVDDPERIVVLTPTRKRPEHLRRSVASLNAMAGGHAQIEQWLLVDDDDIETLALVNSDWIHELKITLKHHVAPRPTTLTEGINNLWYQSSNAGIYLVVTDDYEMLSDGWDEMLRDVYRTGPEARLMICKLRDATRPAEDFVLWAASAEWVNAVGRFLPDYFPFWYADAWTEQVALLAGRMIDPGINLAPFDEMDIGTHGMWNLPFWHRYFDYFMCESIEEAKYLLSLIHGAETNLYSQSLSHLEEALLELDQKQVFTDVQLLRMEKFNSSETGPPTDRYLKAEAKAAQRLAALTPEIKEYLNKRTLEYKRQLYSRD